MSKFLKSNISSKKLVFKKDSLSATKNLKSYLWVVAEESKARQNITFAKKTLHKVKGFLIHFKKSAKFSIFTLPTINSMKIHLSHSMLSSILSWKSLKWMTYFSTTKIPQITEPLQPQQKAIWLTFFWKKWTDSVNVKKFSTRMCLSRSM